MGQIGGIAQWAIDDRLIANDRPDADVSLITQCGQ
jgi:hypothetical protein